MSTSTLAAPGGPQELETSPASAVPVLDHQIGDQKKYAVGTLSYTKWGLVAVFCWMLWGDLVWTLMEHVFPTSMPLQLRRLGVPADWIAIMMSTVGYVVTTAMVPVISFRSDRTRTRWGRRIPYIALTMPLLCLCLAALGYTDEIGAYIHRSGWSARLGLSPMTLIIATIGLLIVLFNFFNIFVNSVYWYLFADVIPEEFLGRFNGAFRMVGGGAGALFGWFVYGKIETHTRYIYLGAALLYLVGFGLMCWRVREGQYPPPHDVEKRGSWLHRIIASIRTYARECFTHPIYICFYLSKATWALSGACGLYYIFFYRDYLGFSLNQIGKFNSVLGIVALVGINLPAGWLADKMHPMRALLLASLLVIPFNIAGFYMNSFTYYMILLSLRMPITHLYDAADIPLMVRIMPRKQFGQFSSANAMVRSFTMILGSIAAGKFIKWTTDHYGVRGNGFGFLWCAGFQTLALLFMLGTYVFWRRCGAENFAFDAEEQTA